MRGYRSLLLIAVVVFVLSGCTNLPMAGDNATAVGGASDGARMAGSAKAATAATGTQAERERAAEKAVVIKLGEKTTVDGTGASVDGSTVRITSSGTYSISGTLKDGQIIVDTKDDKTVDLVLNGVDITSTSSAPIYIVRGKSTVISLADDSENHITDGDSYDIEGPDENEPNAAIFSKGNLTFDGNGSLTIDANYRNAITSKDELDITGGNITVKAVADGIKGRDNVVVKGGNITVTAGADGLQSDNDVDSEKGFVAIEGGTINITAGDDGIQAETMVVIRGGKVTVSSGGGSANGNTDTYDGSQGNGDTGHRSADTGPAADAKGIKATSDIQIEGGTVEVDSSDDAIHSNDSITIDDGSILLASGDDAIRSDYTITINGGDIRITKSYEAIESTVVTINGGNIHLVAGDDGVNVAGDDNGASPKRRPNRGDSNASVEKHLQIEGGYVVVDAMGDGLDVNGWVKMTGGTVIVNGPVVSFNGALDYAREFTMAGGTLVAVGSFGMAQAPDATSTQHSLALSLGSPQPAGTLVHIEAEDGTGILTFAPAKEYQSVVYSSPELKKGTTYKVYLGGTSTGSVVDGVYSGGSYTPDTQSAGRRYFEYR